MNVNNGNSLLPEDWIAEFKSMLSENGASENTVRVYAASVREFYKNHQELTVDELQDYKRELLKKYRPATVNTRIYGINQYVKYQKNSGIPEDFRLPPVRCQQKPFLNNIISKRDYEKLKKGLLKDQDLFWYFVVRFLGATGARVSGIGSDQGRTHCRRLYGSVHERGKNAPYLFSQTALQGNGCVAKTERTVIRIYIYQPLRKAHYSQRDRLTA